MLDFASSFLIFYEIIMGPIRFFCPGPIVYYMLKPALMDI